MISMARRRGTPIFEKAKPRKGLAYTTRQFSILCDDIPLSQISLTELFNIMKKADERGDSYNYEIAHLMYEAKSNPSSYKPNMTEGEARMILQELTPWKIDWT